MGTHADTISGSWTWRPDWVKMYYHSLFSGTKATSLLKTNETTLDFNNGIQNNPNVAHSRFTAVW